MTQENYNYTPAVFYETKAAGEKRYIKRAGNTIGTICFFASLVSVFWSFAAVYISALFGVSKDSVMKALTNPGFMQFVQVLFSTVVFIFPFVIAAKIMKTPISESLSFKKVSGKEMRSYLYIGVAFCALANLVVNFAGSVFENMGFHYNLSDSENPTGVVGFILVCISSAVVPALAEEFGTRGVLIGILRPMGDGFAVLISAIVFGLIHGNFAQIPFAFLVGLALGYIRVKTGSMVVCIIVHFINNFISVCVSYLTDIMGTTAVNALYTVFLAVCVLLGIIGVKNLSKIGSLDFEKADTETKESVKVKWFLTSPMMIVFTVTVVILSCLYFFV